MRAKRTILSNFEACSVALFVRLWHRLGLGDAHTCTHTQPVSTGRPAPKLK